MVSVKDANAIAEVIYYLKGIKKQDVEKIPKKLIKYFEENATKNYECNFDYNKPLKELKLLDETRGIIGMICYNYWCSTEEQKAQYLKRLSENEQQYEENMYEKYNPNNLFKNSMTQKFEVDKTQENKNINNLVKAKEKENYFVKFINFIKSIFKRK